VSIFNKCYGEQSGDVTPLHRDNMAIKSLSPNENRLVYMANESLKRIFEKLEMMDMRLDKMGKRGACFKEIKESWE